MDKNSTGTVLIDTFGDRIKAVFSNTNNRKKMIDIVKKFADKNSDILLSNDMSQRLIFSDADKKLIYQLTEIDDGEITDALKETAIPPQWKKANNTFYVLCILAMNYFFKKGAKEDIECGNALTVYMSYVLYTSNHKATFKYAPNKQCMDYTLNALTNRSYITQEGTIQACIERIVIEAMNGRYIEEIKRCTDDDIAEIISALNTRIASFINKIGDEFYKNYKSGKFISVEDEDTSSEENFHLSDNRSFKIDRVAKLALSEILTKGFDEHDIIDRAMSLGGSAAVSKKKLVVVMDSVKNDMPDTILDMLTSILVQFVTVSGHRIEEVKTLKFVSEEIYVYRSNAQDEMSYHIKDIIDEIMKYIDNKYGKNYIASGASSIANYRKIMFICFVMAIFNSVK